MPKKSWILNTLPNGVTLIRLHGLWYFLRLLLLNINHYILEFIHLFFRKRIFPKINVYLQQFITMFNRTFLWLTHIRKYTCILYSR